MMRYIILFVILLVPSLAIAQGKITRYQDTHTIPHKSVPTKGIENGHEWVDLGLPSGVKWATCIFFTCDPYASIFDLSLINNNR